MYGKKHTVQKPPRRGFTLVELLLYMVLSTTLVILLGKIGIDGIELKQKTDYLVHTLYTGQFVTEKMITSIARASAINSPLPGDTENTLSLLMSNAGENPTVYSVIDGALYVTAGSGEPQRLSAQNVVIEDIEFFHTGTVDNLGTVRIVLDVKNITAEGLPSYIPERFTMSSRVRKTP